jgi:hypothetical protein
VDHSPPVISEAMAWEILDAYVRDCLRIDSDTLIAKRGIIEFNKRRIVPLYLENDPPFTDEPLLELVMRHLETGSVSQDELDLLREHTRMLRDRMNALLRITP